LGDEKLKKIDASLKVGKMEKVEIMVGRWKS